MNMTLDERSHVYRDQDDPDREYVSVSHVLKRLGIRKSWEGGDDPRRDRAVEFARERGIAVERVLYALLRGETPEVEVPDWTSDHNGGESLRESVERFLPGVYRWLETGPAYVGDQAIVADPEAGIAGTLDLLTQTHIVDVKCTAAEEAEWRLQVGAYRSMTRDNGAGLLAVLHINPKFKKGYIWREYDREACLHAWSIVRRAWMDSVVRFGEARAEVAGILK